MNKDEFLRRTAAVRLIPVVRTAKPEEARLAVSCLREAGYGVIELTRTIPDCDALLADLKREFGATVAVGMGTIESTQDGEAALAAGADFLVTPGLVPGLGAVARAAGRPFAMGAFTPSEVMAARREGADAVKIFPAATGGISHLKALRAVFPGQAFIPTGGIGLGDMADWLAAGAVAIGVGGNLFGGVPLAEGRRDELIVAARGFLQSAQGDRA